MRGQLEEARKRREAETREHKRRLNVSTNGDLGSVPHQRIVVVGPCASGKSMLVEALREQGYNAHAAAQEHSYVKTMWQMTRPSHLIYLDVDLPTIRQRRKISWGEEYLDEENERLAHARQNADLLISTSGRSPDQVLQQALEFLESQNYDSKSGSRI
ncbi:MAG: hypothetical protein JWP00_3123 [Chloroflexi bacterium]|jgi:ribosome-interacting GTPase 1|nr:hypothetical protein [Chloroflexota bacterium]